MGRTFEKFLQVRGEDVGIIRKAIIYVVLSLGIVIGLAALSLYIEQKYYWYIMVVGMFAVLFMMYRVWKFQMLLNEYWGQKHKPVP